MGGEAGGELSTCFLLHHLIVGYSNSAHSAHAALKHLLIMIYVISCKKRCLLSSAGRRSKKRCLLSRAGRQARSKTRQIELCCKLFVYFVAVVAVVAVVLVVVAVVIALVFGH